MNTTDGSINAPAPKHERSYSLEGLPDREVLVFKSMVRLLAHRTKFSWVYLPLSTELRVVADGLPTPQLQTPSAQHVLTLGTSNVKRQSYLRLPIHAHELEAELNRLGALIAPANKGVAALAAEFIEAIPMRMLRWPPAALLITPARMRLATLMAGKPLTLHELQQRSKENLAVCAAFFNDLKQNNLLHPASAKQVGTTEPNQQTIVKKTPAQPGLLERIRMRLGLQMPSAAGQSSRA